MKQCQGKKVKVTRSCDVVALKTPDTLREYHPVAEILLSYRKSSSLERMAGSDF